MQLSVVGNRKCVNICERDKHEEKGEWTLTLRMSLHKYTSAVL